MSRFNTIKKSRKRSYEIEEKLNVLNRELEKTKDIQEQPTMNTGDLYTSVAATPPQDPVQVPNPDPDPSTGATTDNWTQPVGDGEDGGTAGDIPTSFPKIWNNPGYQDPTSGWFGANGEPLYSEDDLNYSVPPASQNGGVTSLGGMQRERLGMDPKVVTGYINSDGFVDTDGSIFHNGLAVTFKTHPHLFKPVYYWVPFSIFNPHIDAYWPNNSLGLNPQYQGIVAGSENSNPRALLTAYKYVGGARTQTFDPAGSRGSTTAGDSKGTGDPDQYPPIPWFERLGREAFERLKELAKNPTPSGLLDAGIDAITDLVANVFGVGNAKDTYDDYVDNFIPDFFNGKNPPGSSKDNPKNPYEDGMTNETKNDWEDIFNEYQKELESGVPPSIAKVPKNYQNIANNNGDIGNITGTPDTSSNVDDGFEDNGDGTTTFHKAYDFDGIKDMTVQAGSPILNIGTFGYGVYKGAGTSIVTSPEFDIKKPLSSGKSPTMHIGITFDNKSGKIISSGVKESYRYSKHLIRENAYMALLDRTYKPTERDYVKYAMDTPAGRKQFDKDIKMVHEFIKKNPDKYEYVMKRYPKDDPRLSMLNYRMDRMTEASDKYLETQFPTNQTLFTKVKERTKKSMNLTDPKNFKPVKDPIKYVDVKKTKKLKETVTRHFNKPVKSKSMFGLNMGKVRKTNQKMIEKREQEQRMKEEEKAYIQEKMSRQKSNWKDDLTEV